MKTPATRGNPGRAVEANRQPQSTAFLPEKPARSTFVLRLEPLPGIDGHKALRAALKRLRRNHGLNCVARREEAAPTSGMSHEQFENFFEHHQQAQEERHAGRRPEGGQ